MRIFLAQAFDMALFFAVFATGLITIFYFENKSTMLLATFIGLFLVNKLGVITAVKVSELRVEEMHRIKTIRNF